MKYFYKLLSLAVFLPLFSLAQSNYKPGYMVNLKGDTTRGYIDFRGWESNPNSISFKTKIADTRAQKLGPDDINFFNVDNLVSYQKYSGKISMNPTDPNHVINGRDSSFKMATVFLKLLQKGDKIILYEYADDIKPRFYIAEKPGDTPYELEYKIYTNSESTTNAGKTVSENTYMTQLYNLAVENEMITDRLQVDIERTEYSESGIQDIVTKFNGKSSSENSKHTKLVFFVGAALKVTHTAPTNTFKGFGSQPYSSYLPAISAGLDIPVIANSDKLIFRLELSIEQSKYTSTYDNKVSPFVNITYAFNTLSFAGTPQMIYNFYNADNLKFYAGFGLSITGYRYSNVKYQDKDGNNVPTSADPYHSFAGFGNPIVIKTGILLNKKYGIYANYSTGGRVSDDYVYRLSFSSVQIGFNYYLN